MLFPTPLPLSTATRIKCDFAYADHSRFPIKMGFMSSIRKLSSSEQSTGSSRKQSIVDYETKLTEGADGEELSQEDQQKKSKELDMFSEMTDREKGRWIKCKGALGKWSTMGERIPSRRSAGSFEPAISADTT